MIDFHTHILPGIDDGSRDEAMTQAMLLEQRRQGVELVVATPHFYADRVSVNRFLDKRAEALQKAERIRHESSEPLPELCAGAEVYYFNGIGQAAEIPKLCIGNTRTLLLEMPFEQWNERTVGEIRDLTSGQGLRVVIAHIERYAGFQRQKTAWDRVLAMDLTFQINAGSFIKQGGILHRNGRQRFCLDFLAQHPRTIIGSDCHNMSERRPNLAQAREQIAEKLGEKALQTIDDACARVLERTDVPD